MRAEARTRSRLDALFAGKNILRAETAAIAGLAVIRAWAESISLNEVREDQEMIRPERDDEDLESEGRHASELGPNSAGQSGDLQGLSDDEDSNSESVTELLEEGQAFEASIVSGIENAPLADEGPVKTRQVNEDDVPGEYLEARENEK